MSSPSIHPLLYSIAPSPASCLYQTHLTLYPLYSFMQVRQDIGMRAGVGTSPPARVSTPTTHPNPNTTAIFLILSADGFQQNLNLC
ncbi:MAG: hypothetical protein K6T90_19475 [Leptolyngbyaceae cyanobacterium HOT.MB2.61]|nr:hypothetical protein [Leptolyngbyaceae cyanobacterium HOT.MB2.61]